MNKKEPFEYELPPEFKFEYSRAGNIETAQFVKFFAPNAKVMHLCSDMKQTFFRALPQQSSDVDTSQAEEIEIDGDQILMLITQSREVDLSKFLLTARELFSNDFIALIDGEQRFTKPILDELDSDCLEDMVGQYMANFILASALEKMKKLLSQK